MTDPFKTALRQSIRAVREKLTLQYQHNASRRICARIASLEPYRYARHIALYSACRGEIDLSDLWQTAAKQGKNCYFPAVNADQTLRFLPAAPTTAFKENHYQIPEPDVDDSQAVSPGKLDIIFLPLVAFDEYGTRLGMGGGYYDRTLASERPPLLIGVAYEFQRQDYLQAESWDIPLTLIVTEKTVYWSDND
ncbi:5-formyltetrahydrofolate cyclo-ligase [Legionella dresdenensis]|uniref:5-formyltetrahydrofolate cyclo-ligase n=1 Tax=Legionella dresdenensis TaxID=450200 RepID=A0ABV8CF18_9GAMM